MLLYIKSRNFLCVACAYKRELATIIHDVNMTRKKRRYKYGDYIIREIKGRYYVYKLETANGDVKERYVGPLDKVVEFYINYGGVGVFPNFQTPP